MIDKNKLQELFDPTKLKIISTLFIYLALFAASWWKIILSTILYPELRSMVFTSKSETSRLFASLGKTASEKGSTTILGSNLNQALLLMILSSAGEFLFLYLAVSFIIYFSGRKKQV